MLRKEISQCVCVCVCLCECECSIKDPITFIRTKLSNMVICSMFELKTSEAISGDESTGTNETDAHSTVLTVY